MMNLTDIEVGIQTGTVIETGRGRGNGWLMAIADVVEVIDSATVAETGIEGKI